MNYTLWLVLLFIILALQFGAFFYFLFWLHRLVPREFQKKYPAMVRASPVIPFSNYWRHQVEGADVIVFDKVQKGFRILFMFTISTFGIQVVIMLWALRLLP